LVSEMRNCFSSINQGKLNIKDLDEITAQILTNSSSEALLALASLQKSEQTFAHSVDVGLIYLEIYKRIMLRGGAEYHPLQQQELLLGAFLHDIGKSKLPLDILENERHFDIDCKEMQLIRTHPDLSRDILAAMQVDDLYCDMAYHHHVKMDGDLISSYPKGINYRDLSFESKLLGVVDVYQALIGKRKYKKPWSPPEAISYLDNLVGIEIGEDAWQPFFQILGQYPIGSFVQLNDGAMGFVIKPSQKELNKPSIALVINGKGEPLGHNSLINLETEKNLSIVRHLRPEDHLGDQVINTFSNLKIF